MNVIAGKTAPMFSINCYLLTVGQRQDSTEWGMDWNKEKVFNQATALQTQWNGSTVDKQGIPVANCNNDALKTDLQRAFGRIDAWMGDTTAFASKGDLIIQRGLEGISIYLAEIELQLPASQRERFADLMDAYRAKAYIDHRGENDATVTKNQNDLTGIYNKLGDVNAANIDDFFTTVVIPDLSVKLNVNPGLIENLLNQVKDMERVYANVDDIKARGFEPVNSNYGGIYHPINNARSVAFARSFVEDEIQRQAAEQGIDLGK